MNEGEKMYTKKIDVIHIMNAIEACTEMNFQKKLTIILEIICEKNNMNFEKIQPSNGDGKNDGWISDKNIYFAMYSPNDSKISENKQIVAKLQGDLDGLCNQVYNYNRWGKEISEFYLIVNTHDKDLPADPDRLRENKIKEIKEKYKVDFTAKVLAVNTLKKFLLRQKMNIIKEILDNLDIETVNNDFSIPDVLDFIDEYCTYLSQINIKENDVSNLKITTLEKIEINKLTDKKEHILSFILASDKIEQYISYMINEGIGIEKYNKVKNYIIEKYKKLEVIYSGVDLYNKLLDELINDSMLNSQVNILEAIVINIFIRCDIFKKE